jgi:probable addiction module antidote protein
MKTTRFDASELLDTPARRAAYLSAALETGDAEEIRDALGVIARTRGVAVIARHAHLSRTGLYKAFGENGNPELGTVVRVLASVGIRLMAKPTEQPRKPRAAAKPNATGHRGHSRKPETAHA